MSEVTQMRLSKVAKEFNLSLGKITEFLAAKGRPVENNPNAKIGAEEYTLLSKEFSGDKSAKEEAQHVGLNLTKIKRESFVVEDLKSIKAREEEEIRVKEAAANVAKAAAELKAAEEKKQEAIKTAAIKAALKSAEPEEEVKEEVKEAPNGITGPKVLGKMDLSTLNQKTKPDKKTKKEKDDEKIAEEKLAKETKATKGKKKKEEVVEEIAPVVETPIVVEPTSIPEEIKEVFHETIYQKLEGPKIMGKIELPVIKEVKKSTTPVPGSFADKKKRKRIRKGGVTEAEIKKVGAEQAQIAKDKAKEKYGDPRARKPVNAPREARPALTDEEIQTQIKETLARLSNKGSKSKTSKYRRDKRDDVRDKMAEAQEQTDLEKKTLQVTEFVSANQLAQMMNVSVTQIISTCMSLGLFVSINQRLDAETLAIVAEEFGFKTEFVSVEVQEAIDEQEIENPEDLVERPPDRKSTRLNSSHPRLSRMPSSA